MKDETKEKRITIRITEELENKLIKLGKLENRTKSNVAETILIENVDNYLENAYLKVAEPKGEYKVKKKK